MIYALYGDDTYRSRKKLRSIVEEYRIKSGSDFNMHRFDAQDDDLSDIKAIIGAKSLFAAKKLSIIEYAFCERVTALLHPFVAEFAASKDQVIIMWDGALDASKKKYIKMWENFFTKAQEFSPLSSSGRKQWILQEADERGIILNNANIKQLTQSTDDSWALIQLLEKIATKSETDTYVSFTGNENIFSLGDNFFLKNSRAIHILHELLGRGEDEFGLFSYLTNRSRALVAVKVCEQEHKLIPSWLGIHPFVIKKTSQLVHNLSLDQCRVFCLRFFEEDARIKIGLIRPSESLMDILLG